jgi:hypothetical protein
MADDNIDMFLSETIKAAAIEIDTPISEVEQKIAKKIQENQQIKKRKKRHITQAAVITVALVSASSLLLFPKEVTAFKEQLIQQITYVNGKINIALNNDPNQSQQAISEMEKEINKIQANIPFRILTPKYIPEDYEFKSIESPNPENKRIVISFVADDSELFFYQTQVSKNFSYSINVNAAQGTSEQVQVGNYIGNIFVFKNGFCSLTWETDDYILCEISGKISTEQIKEMAASI